MKKITLITAIIIALFCFHACNAFSQDLVKYKGQMYEVVATPEGTAEHRYFIQLADSSLIALSKLDGWEKPVDNGDGTATYKKEIYTIETGPRGGRYIITKTGTKHYIPKVVQPTVN